MSKKITLGISSCLLGKSVRFNGSHKRSAYCVEELSEWFDYKPVCPEVEIGMGIPREPIRLVQQGDDIRVKNVTDHSNDFTDDLVALADKRVADFADLDGFIFMQKSPSCGLFGVKVYNENGMPGPDPDQGAFAKRIQKAYPLMPMEEAGRLNDAVLRENFLTRVFAHAEWKEDVLAKPLPKSLVAFHTKYKYLLQVRSEKHYRELGQLVAKAGSEPFDELSSAYFALFMFALSQRAVPGDHVNVMQHMLGFIKNDLDHASKHSILNLIDLYQNGDVELLVPLTLLKHYIEKFNVEYLINQKYLSPFPQSFDQFNQAQFKNKYFIS
ncbi:DUF523 and DUF1722 domain-containing protein [Marinicella rhabdoformis]|uniref:DUF523 and DUF1722 domain-containing protein n=1 Tax=Marinicella rhabdoformis TaxID=2580566 RepID=UPI0012AED793|nr:DUF523 and DUF1722 domain-containing protein [Marinicella rhabdoformis]